MDKLPVIEGSGKTLLAPVYHLELVKDRELPYDALLNTTAAAAQVLHQLLDRSAVEQMAVLYLSSDAKIVGAEKVSTGGLEAVATNPQEFFRGALIHGVPEILLSHNHLGNSVEPSMPDIMTTMRTVSLGAMLGLRVRDHIIVNSKGEHYSIRENMDRLEPRLREEEKKMFGTTLSGLKDKILEAIRNGHSEGVIEINADDIPGLGDSLSNLTGGAKKGGDPKANVFVNIENTLTYQWLTHR